LATLLEALGRIHRPVQVIAVGVRSDVRLREAIKNTRLDGRVRLVGLTADPLPFYAAADCFVLPTRYDTFSLATLEAMACGLPVIVSRAAGVTEHLTDGLDSLLLQDPTDATSLAGYLDRLTNDKGLGITLGAKARKTAERFSWEKVADQTLAVYRQVL
jgi:UDP-glucose:(heptosyl)LPS alpha-1,3-glucosyltransferase